MKSLNFLLNSFPAKIVLLLSAFALSVGITALIYSQYLHPTPRIYQSAQKFEKPNLPIVQLQFIDVENPITANIVQSKLVDFPVNGRVTVQSVEKIGEFPQMIFISKKTGKVLHRSSIEDEDKWLIPDNGIGVVQPNLRFRVIRSSGFKSPMIMSVGVSHGGSDSAYYLTVFGEINGKIKRLNKQALFANIQGGFYLGHLNKKLGYGLAVWSFIWGDTAHYAEHNYNMQLFQIQDGELKRKIRKISRKKYDFDEGFNSLRELSIKAGDQRRGIPIIQDGLE